MNDDHQYTVFSSVFTMVLSGLLDVSVSFVCNVVWCPSYYVPKFQLVLRLMLFVKLWSPMEARPIMGAWISPDLGRDGGEWRRSGVSRRSSRGHSIVWMSTVEAFGLCLGDSFL